MIEGGAGGSCIGDDNADDDGEDDDNGGGGSGGGAAMEVLDLTVDGDDVEGGAGDDGREAARRERRERRERKRRRRRRREQRRQQGHSDDVPRPRSNRVRSRRIAVSQQERAEIRAQRAALADPFSEVRRKDARNEWMYSSCFAGCWRVNG